MISEPAIFLQQVFEQAIARSPHLSGTLAGADKSATETVLVEFLGERLAALFSQKPSRELPSHSKSDRNGSPAAGTDWDELVDRNIVLAAALGACECWGEQPSCATCRGAGGPGWRLPDRQLFSIFVFPAIEAMRKSWNSRTRAAITLPRHTNGEQR